MMNLEKLALAVSAVFAFSLSSSVLAQQMPEAQQPQAGQVQTMPVQPMTVQPMPSQPMQAQQPQTQAAPAQGMPAPQQGAADQYGPAAIVIQKLVATSAQGDFPCTQEELDRATEFLMKKAKAEGLNVTRDEILVGMGFIAGSLATFMDIQKQAASMQPQAQSPLPPEVMPAPNEAMPQAGAGNMNQQPQVLIPVQPMGQVAPSAPVAPQPAQ